MADIVLSSASYTNMIGNPLFLKATGGDPAITYSAQDYRAMLDALWTYEGVVGSGDFAVTQRAAGANLSVDIAGGKALISGDSVARQGKYQIESTGTVNSAAGGTNISVPGTGTYTHRVILRARDKAAAGSNYDWTIEVLQDTGTGLPAEPPSAITLATIAVPSGSASITTAMITDLRPFASQNGVYRTYKTISVAAHSVTLNIPSTVRVWTLNVRARTTSASSFCQVYARVNGTSSASYMYYDRYIDTAAVNLGTAPAATGVAQMALGYVTANSNSSGRWGAVVAECQGWNLSSGASLTILSHSGWADTWSMIDWTANHYAGAAPYTTLTCYANTPDTSSDQFVVGSEFVLRGMI